MDRWPSCFVLAVTLCTSENGAASYSLLAQSQNRQGIHGEHTVSVEFELLQYVSLPITSLESSNQAHQSSSERWVMMSGILHSQSNWWSSAFYRRPARRWLFVCLFTRMVTRPQWPLWVIYALPPHSYISANKTIRWSPELNSSQLISHICPFGAPLVWRWLFPRIHRLIDDETNRNVKNR